MTISLILILLLLKLLNFDNVKVLVGTEMAVVGTGTVLNEDGKDGN